MDPYREQLDEAADQDVEDPRERLGALRLVEPKDNKLAMQLARRRGIYAAVIAVVIIVSTPTNAKSLVTALAVVVLFVFGPVLPALWRYWTTKIELHESGLVVHEGSTSDVILFEDVDEVWLDLEHGDKLALINGLRLVDNDGVTHRVPFPLMMPDEVLRSVYQNCSLSLLADARRALDDGEDLTFGDVTVASEGILVGDTGTRWESLDLVRFHSGRIEFFRDRSRRAWRKVKLDEVPHPDLFSTLVRQLAPRTEDENLDGLIAKE